MAGLTPSWLWLSAEGERLWDLRQKRDREMHGTAEWEERRSLASAIKEHGLNAWGRHCEVPHPPKQTCHSWYQANRGEKK